MVARGAEYHLLLTIWDRGVGRVFGVPSQRPKESKCSQTRRFEVSD